MPLFIEFCFNMTNVCILFTSTFYALSPFSWHLWKIFLSSSMSYLSSDHNPVLMTLVNQLSDKRKKYLINKYTNENTFRNKMVSFIHLRGSLKTNTIYRNKLVTLITLSETLLKTIHRQLEKHQRKGFVTSLKSETQPDKSKRHLAED